jgi:hypothetical protein
LDSSNRFVNTVVHQIQRFVQMSFLHDQKSLLRRSGREFGG